MWRWGLGAAPAVWVIFNLWPVFMVCRNARLIIMFAAMMAAAPMSR